MSNLKVNHKGIAILPSIRGGGDFKAIGRETGAWREVSAKFVKVTFDLPKHISKVCFAAIILVVS